MPAYRSPAAPLALALLVLATAPARAGSPAPAAPPAPYSAAGSVRLGAPDRWDYVTFDPETGRVYVAHADRISVVDGARLEHVGDVEGLSGGAHGVAVRPGSGLGYATDGHTGEVAVFDLKSLRILRRIAVGPDADGVVYDPSSGRLFVMLGDPGQVAVVDPETDRVIAKIDCGAPIEAPAADGRGHVFVAGAARSEILRIDTHALRIDQRTPAPDCAKPHGMAVDGVGRRVFATCVNARMAVFDADTGARIGSAPIGRGTDSAAFDPSTGRALSADGVDGVLSTVVISGTAPTALAPVPTAQSGRTLAVDPKSGRVFIALAHVDPPAAPGARPRVRPGTLRLMALDPAR